MEGFSSLPNIAVVEHLNDAGHFTGFLSESIGTSVVDLWNVFTYLVSPSSECKFPILEISFISSAL